VRRAPEGRKALWRFARRA